ncbi:MAG: hypothetical protein OHK0024_16390 [Thalassobaculales bacterium]
MSDPVGCASDYGRLREVLICPPDHFQWFPANAVAVETMRKGLKLDLQAVRRQYREMHDALTGAGVVVREVGTDPHLCYQSYTRDPGVVFPWGVFLTQMYRAQRRGETAPLSAFCHGRGLPVWRWATAGSIEGGDIHLLRPGQALIGWSGGRTEESSARQLADWLAAEGWQAKLYAFPEHFLHLDLLFAVAGEGIALACTEVLEEELLSWLKGIGYELIPVSYKEAMQLQNNVLALGDGKVLSSAGSAAVNARLRAAGLTVLDPDLTLYTAGGGGPRCLTMPVWRE